MGFGRHWKSSCYGSVIKPSHTGCLLVVAMSLAIPVSATVQESSGLVEAARAGDTALVRKLLVDGADVNEIQGGDTALIASAQRGHIEVAALLLEADADVNAGYNQGYPALTFATFGGHSELVTLLVKHRARVKIRSPLGVTPLLGAAAAGDPETVKLLLDKGADARAADNRGRTPLMFAAASGNPRTAELLLAAGAELDVQSSDGYTAVTLAEIYERTEILNVLGVATLVEETSVPSPSRMKDGTTAPRLDKQVPPRFSDDAVRRSLEGDVLLEVVITKEGQVGEVHVKTSVDIELDLLAIECVRKWQFTPGMADGVPVDVIAEIAVAFDML